jgi:subtilisin
MQFRNFRLFSSLAVLIIFSVGCVGLDEEYSANDLGNGLESELGEGTYLLQTGVVRSIVILKENAGKSSDIADEMAQRHGFVPEHVYSVAMQGFSTSIPIHALKSMRADKRVRYIVQDQRVEAYSQTLPAGLERVNAEQNQTANINGNGGQVDVDIAILDTGIDRNHPDLNVYQFVNFAKGGANAGDGNGHGTHVAGTAAARDNDFGVVGVAPGARLWAVRVLDNRGSGWVSDIIKGIDYVTANADQIDVANMSLGGSGSSDGNCGRTKNDPMHEAICNSVDAGVVYVVAAGNSGDDARKYTPAAYEEVITVSAIADSDGQPGGFGPATRHGADDTFAAFSNFGPAVDIAAPGVDVLSTYPGNSYASLSGTSMAAPHVAGAVALYIALNGKPAHSTEVAAVANALISLADPQDSERGFSGDPDAYAEPLLNAEAIHPMGPVAPAEPAVFLSLSTDQKTYNTALSQATVVLTIVVQDENQDPVSALSSSAFVTEVNGVSSSVSFLETTNLGTYQGLLDISTASDGTHVVKVTVTDARDLSAGATSQFDVTSKEADLMKVASIHYGGTGGRLSDKHLLITLQITDDSGTPVSGADVSADVFLEGKLHGTGAGVTDSNGKLTLESKNARAGCYAVTVQSVNHGSFLWENSLDVADPGFCK